VGREATEVANFFRNRALCAMAVVTTAEPLAMAETLDLDRQLAKLQLETAAVFFNRASRAAFENADITRMVRRWKRKPEPPQARHLAEIARAELRRKNREGRAFEILRRQVSAPMIVLRECANLAGINLLDDLCEQLASTKEPSAAAAKA
jgi:hypothetical protein